MINNKKHKNKKIIILAIVITFATICILFILIKANTKLEPVTITEPVKSIHIDTKGRENIFNINGVGLYTKGTEEQQSENHTEYFDYGEFSVIRYVDNYVSYTFNDDGIIISLEVDTEFYNGGKLDDYITMTYNGKSITVDELISMATLDTNYEGMVSDFYNYEDENVKITIAKMKPEYADKYGYAESITVSVPTYSSN